LQIDTSLLHLATITPTESSLQAQLGLYDNYTIGYLQMQDLPEEVKVVNSKVQHVIFQARLEQMFNEGRRRNLIVSGNDLVLL
jgi:hypothetical protein